jgi:D-alanine transaminase
MLLHNGVLKSVEQVSISPMDRGYYFGDGIYEVFRVYQGRLFEEDAHMRRLLRSADSIRLSMPFSQERILRDLQLLIEVNQLNEGTVYLQITRGEASRAHGLPSDLSPVSLAWCKPVSRPLESIRRGISAVTRPDIRWQRCDIKSLNLLANSMLKQEAVDAGVDEVVLHRENVVTECSASNIMMVKNGVIRTHPANHLILHGVTRAVVQKLARHLEIPLEEQPFTIQELAEADEAFITGTTVEVTPVVQVDGASVGDGRPGPISTKLQSAFEELIL